MNFGVTQWIQIDRYYCSDAWETIHSIGLVYSKATQSDTIFHAEIKLSWAEQGLIDGRVNSRMLHFLRFIYQPLYFDNVCNIWVEKHNYLICTIFKYKKSVIIPIFCVLYVLDMEKQEQSMKINKHFYLRPEKSWSDFSFR